MAAVSRAAYLKSNTLQDTITSSFIILQRCVCVCGEGGDGGGGGGKIWSTSGRVS